MSDNGEDYEPENLYDEIDIEDMDFYQDTFTYQCPCGDKFRITYEQLKSGQSIALCPSCPLKIRVIFDKDDLDSLVAELRACAS